MKEFIERRKIVCPIEDSHTILVKEVTEIKNTLIKIEQFMENLSGLNDISAGIVLLKKPTLWLLAFVVGLLALFGGLKAILSFIFLTVTTK